jgi:2-aminoadipate transaminase
MDHRFAYRAQDAQLNPIDSASASAEEERDLSNFNHGWTNEQYLPADEVTRACEEVLSTNHGLALQYTPRKGIEDVRETIAEYMTAEFDISADTENIMVTTGAKQGIDLICKLFLDPGDTVAVTTPTYATGISIFETHEAEFLEIPMDEDGMIVDRLAAEIDALREQGKDLPKFIYDVPEFHNPTGITMSRERREQLIDLAEDHEIMILEDDPYRRLRVEGEPVPAIKSLTDSDLVTFLGTYSKLVCPGIRVGWMVADETIVNRLPKFKEDGGTSGLNQLVISQLHEKGYLQEREEEFRRFLHSQRDKVVDSIREHLPSANIHHVPEGGFYLWLELPDGVDSTKLTHYAKESGVLFMPAEAYYPTDGPQNYLRLALAYEDVDEIESGIKRIADALERYRRTERIDMQAD